MVIGQEVTKCNVNDSSDILFFYVCVIMYVTGDITVAVLQKVVQLENKLREV